MTRNKAVFGIKKFSVSGMKHSCYSQRSSFKVAVNVCVVDFTGTSLKDIYFILHIRHT